MPGTSPEMCPLSLEIGLGTRPEKVLKEALYVMTVNNWLTTYLPQLVNVIIERPLSVWNICPYDKKKYFRAKILSFKCLAASPILFYGSYGIINFGI